MRFRWDQEGAVDAYLIFWKIENGTDHNIRFGSIYNDYSLNDPSLTPATMYYISLAAVLGMDVSDRSETIYRGTGTL